MAKVRAIAGVPATAKKSAEIKLKARPKVKMSVVAKLTTMQKKLSFLDSLWK